MTITPDERNDLVVKAVELADELLTAAKDYAANGKYARGTKKDKIEFAIVASIRQLTESADRTRSTMVAFKYEINTGTTEAFRVTLHDQWTVLQGAAEGLAGYLSIDISGWYNSDDV